MNTAAALLAAVREQPDDDLPRLAYADWLEEQGDAARAQFIRLQCRLARLESGEPEFEELNRQSWALRGEHEPRWRAELPTLPGVTWDSFTRGFVEGALVASWRAFQREAGHVHEAIHFRHLTLHLGTQFKRFPSAEGFPGIESLSLWGRSGLTSECLVSLAGLPQLGALRHLSLTGGGVRSDAVTCLSNSPHLAALESLGLSANPDIGPEGGLALARSPHWRNMQALDLFNIQMGDEAGVALASSPVAARLRRLLLDANQLGDTTLHALAASPNRGLEELFLSGNAFTLAGLRALLDSPVVRSLRLLALDGNPLGDELAAAVATADGLGGLRRLYLNGCDLGPEGARHLARSPHLTQLAWLSLNDNHLGDDGAAALASESDLRRLQSLSLTGNRIGNAGGQALARSRYRKALWGGGIASNPITGDVWLELHQRGDSPRKANP